MPKKRIFITGGTGFFGKSLLAEWQKAPEANYELLILSRDSKKFLAQNPDFANLPFVSFLDGDLRDFTFPHGKFSALIHAASPAELHISDTEISSIIIDGTKRVLDFCSFAGIDNLLFISSGAVYGEASCAEVKFSEADLCRPYTAYGKSKLLVEELCLKSKIPCKIARCFSFIGEYLPLDKHFAAGNFIRNCLNNENIKINGDGKAQRSYMYAVDLIKTIWQILKLPDDKLIMNVGSDQAISIKKLAKEIKKAAKSSSSIIIENKASSSKQNRVYLPNIDLMKMKIKLPKTHTLQEALKKIIAYHQDN